MRKLLLGIDLGTSACKVVAFTPEGEVVAHSSAAYPVFYPAAGWAEQDPEDWWRAACDAIRQMLAQNIAPGEICGIGIDGQSWSAVAVDSRGEVLCNTPIWMDTRAEKICDCWRKEFGEECLLFKSGNPVQPMYTMPKVRWYRENMPAVYARCHKVLQSNGFLVYRLTNKITQDISQGYGWNCFDMRLCRWDEGLCCEMGVGPELLPELAPCHQAVGGVSKSAAALTGLLEGTPVVAGGLDAACATLGAGVIHPGETQEQGGQAGGMSVCVSSALIDRRLILGAHVVPGLYLVQGGTVAGSASLRWFESEFGAEERAAAQKLGISSFEELSREAGDVPAGSEGLVFLPYLSGERSPIWDVNAKGVFFGIDFSKHRSHFVRAVMEGVAFALRHNLETAEEAGAGAQILYATGGAANSAIWTQIKADVTGRRIVVPAAGTATALGAAMLAGVGVGVYEDFAHAVRKTLCLRREHAPDPENRDVYQKRYETYRAIYEDLKQTMSEARA